MAARIIIQGREITSVEIGLIRDLKAENRDWGRTRLSEELCLRWNWRNVPRRMKDIYLYRLVANIGKELSR